MPHDEHLTLADIEGLLETYPGLIGIMSLDGTLLAAGSRYANLMGHQLEDMIGHNNREYAMHPVSVDTIIRKACEQGYFDSELISTNRAGTSVRLRLTGWPCMERNVIIFALSGAFDSISREELAHSIQSLISPGESVNDLMTKNEVAHVLKVNVRTVERMCARKELPSIRVGERHIRIPKRALLDYLRHRATGTS